MNTDTSHIRLQQSGPIPLDVEFSCEKGEIFVLVGPSGSGKTTTLRSIAGLYRPASGKVVCQGNVWFDSENNINVPVQKRPVGLVFQHYALFPHLTARENIAIALNKDRNTDPGAQLKQLIEMVHLNGLEHRYPHKLSGGQQQRVALARALARQPAILLLDEPFSSVDQQTRRHLVRELVRLRHQVNIPIIHVTHNLNEARRIADRICIIDAGKSLQIDEPEVLMARPGNADVARLTGHDNVFHGIIHAQEPQAGLTRIRWHQHILTTTYQQGFDVNEEIDWMIPSSHISLYREHTGSPISPENTVDGRIVEYVQLGEGSFVLLAADANGQELHMNVSSHTARTDNLGPGAKIRVYMVPESIHIMKKTSAA